MSPISKTPNLFVLRTKSGYFEPVNSLTLLRLLICILYSLCTRNGMQNGNFASPSSEQQKWGAYHIKSE